MWFNIITENHGLPETVQRMAPIIRYLRRLLGAAGHAVTVCHDQLYPDAINLYAENFLARDYAAEFRRLRVTHPSLRIGVIATELMLGGTIPYARHGITFKSHSGGEQLIRRRVAAFESVLEEIDFLWSFLERTAAEYRGRCAVSEFLPVGCNALVSSDETRSPKDIDVFFFGKMTPHRAGTINRLVEGGLQVVVAGEGTPTQWLPDFMLESLLDRSRIALNLTLHAHESGEAVDPRFASCLRLKEMLERGACVVSEEIPLDNPYAPFMVSAPIDRLETACVELIRGGDFVNRGREAAIRFEAEMNAERVCRPAIDRTLRALRVPITP